MLANANICKEDDVGADGERERASTGEGTTLRAARAALDGKRRGHAKFLPFLGGVDPFSRTKGQVNFGLL